MVAMWSIRNDWAVWIWNAIQNQNHSTSKQLLSIQNPNMFDIRAPTEQFSWDF